MEAEISHLAFDERVAYFHTLVEKYEDRLPVVARFLQKPKFSSLSTL